MTDTRARALAAFVGAVGATGLVRAQETRGYPVKPVRAVTVSSGSQADTVVRMLSPKLVERW
jgi:hypothetical protein